MRFRDRREAGRQLGRLVAELGLPDPVVLGLPRGGIPVAAEVAAALGVPLDVFVARKVGAPGQEELGIAAVAEGGALVSVGAALGRFALSDTELAGLVDQERVELARRVQRYRGDRPLPDLAGRDAVLVDDGLATGVTAEAALAGLARLGPRSRWLAVPVAAADTRQRLDRRCDGVVVLHAPATFFSVGQFYEDFTQVSDDEVIALLEGGR